MSRLFACTVAVLTLTVAANAQSSVVTERNIVREGFSFPEHGPIKILVFRPEIKVGEQTTAGLFQPNAEWHEASRKALTDALIAASKTRSFNAVLQDEPKSQQAASYAEYRALFRLVVNNAIRHKLFARDPLPSKAMSFDWSLGRGLRSVVTDQSANYGLFLFSHDGFESSGRRAAQLVSSLLGGRDVAGTHLGYAALVDLNSGDLLWLNVDLKAAGDVRTPEGAALRIEHLLAGFPSRANVQGRSGE